MTHAWATVLRASGLHALGQVIGTYGRESPGMTAALLALATLSGLLLPGFMLSTAALLDALRAGAPAVVPLALVGAFFAGQRMLDPIRQQLSDTLWPRIDDRIDDRIMAALSRPPGLQEIEDTAVRDRVTQAEGALTGFTIGQAAQLLAVVWMQRLQIIASLLIIGRVYWWAAAALLATYVVAHGVSHRHYEHITVVMYGRTEQMRRAYYLRSLGLSSRVAKEARIFDLSSWLVHRYRDSSLAVLSEIWAKRNEGWLASLGVVAALAAVELATLGTVAVDAVAGRESLGTAIAVAQAALIAGILSMFQDSDFAVAEASRSIEKVKELEAAASDVKTVATGTRSAAGLPRRAIRFENVTFAYPGRAEPVFDRFNLEIEAGRSLAIVGENGAGKTTLVKLLTRLYDPNQGSITVDGIDLRDLAPAAWHRRVAAVFQDFARFELPAYDNIAFGAVHAPTDSTGVTRAAVDAGAIGIIERLPNGWSTVLSREFRGGTQLSGGEWQRLALARALFGVASGAGVLILDEPTASLDVRGEAEVYARFLDLTRGVTTIVISHRFSTVRRADRIVVIEGGQVIEDGTHDELVARGGRYAEMYTLQAARFAEVSAADA